MTVETVTIEDVTISVNFELPVGTRLPLTQCVCGEKFARGALLLGMDPSNPKPCPKCGRLLCFHVCVTVYEVKP